MEVESQIHLYGHTAEVTSLFVCKPYSILISVSKDGTCILWDLNRSACVAWQNDFSLCVSRSEPLWGVSSGCVMYRASRATKAQ